MLHRLIPFLLSFFVVLPAPGQTIFISEFHYDNDGTDSGEAIEIAGPAGTDVTDWSLVLYNGTDGTVYDTRTLSGTLPDTCGGYGVLVETYPTNGIQNGEPDGIVLVDDTGAVVEAIAYEGTFAAVDGPAAGRTLFDIGPSLSESSSTPESYSLQRFGVGMTARGFFWAAPAENTFESCNVDQIFGVVGFLRNDDIVDHETGISINEVSQRSAITDFNADGFVSAETDRDEFVELTNNSSESIDVNGWSVGDDNDTIVLDGLAPVPPRHSLVMFMRGADVSNFDPGDGNQVISLADLALDDFFDVIGVKNQAGLYIALRWNETKPGTQLSTDFLQGSTLVGQIDETARGFEGRGHQRIPEYSGDFSSLNFVNDTVDWSVDGLVQLENPGGTPGRNRKGQPFNERPFASFVATPIEGQAPVTVEFNALGYSEDADQDDLTYYWELGDGTTSTESIVEHIYSEAGDYRVLLEVSDGSLTDTTSSVVSVASGVSNETNDAPQTFTLDSVYPNPFNSRLNIGFSVPDPSTVRVEVWTLLGRNIYGSEDGSAFSAGPNRVTIETGSWPAGVYIVKISTDLQSQMIKAVRVRD